MKTKVKVLAVLLMMFVVFVGQSSAQEMGRYIVTIEGHPGPAKQAVIRAGGAVDHVYDIISAIAIRIPEAAVPGFSRNPFVLLVERDIEVYAIDAELDDSWGVKRIGAGTVHDGGNKGNGVTVVVIDTGIDYTHPDLDNNYVGGYDFVNGDDYPMDDNGHGTHVAGTVAAEDNGSGVVGVAPEASLYAIKVLDDNGSGYYSDVIAALGLAMLHGQVANLSLGSSQDPGEAVKIAFDMAAEVMVIVAAAGNSGNPPGMGDNVIYPARYDSCIAVAATDQSDSRARWSSTGPDLGISAPGVGINSTLLGGGYGTKSGTSMAAPHVAGTLALNLQFGIFETADDLGPSGWDSKYGYGLVDAAEAAGAPPPQPPTLSSISVTPTSASIQEGQTQQFTAIGSFDDGSTADLTSTATWASSNTAVATVDASGLATGIAAGTTDITATQDGVTSNAAALDVTLATTTDTVTINKAEYNFHKSELKVEATSSEGGTAVLTVVGYGTMTYESRKNRYKFRDKPVSDPGGTVTVTSSLGGSATKTVKYK